VLLVASGRLGRYIGHLNIVFDSFGKVTGWSGDSVRLDTTVVPGLGDPQIYASLNASWAEVQAYTITPVGTSAKHMSGDRNYCRFFECEVGNMLADAIRLKTGADVGFVNGGSAYSPLHPIL